MTQRAPVIQTPESPAQKQILQVNSQPKDPAPLPHKGKMEFEPQLHYHPSIPEMVEDGVVEANL